MSGKLVKRLLHHSNELLLETGTGGVGSSTSATNTNTDEAKRLSRKRRKQQEKLAQQQEATPASQDEVADWHVQSLLRLDTKIAARSAQPSTAKERLLKEQKEARKQRKSLKGNILGNSRSSAQQKKVEHIPTFNKKRYKKEKEQKRLEQIARLLDKRSKKTKK